jgi:asparagine synthase (glutamine-hydrolysing)
LHFDEQHRQPFAAARDTFRNLIRDSIAEEVVGHQRVGAFLSGGTDSSTVAGMLCQVTGKPAPAYSIGFDAEGTTKWCTPASPRSTLAANTMSTT